MDWKKVGLFRNEERDKNISFEGWTPAEIYCWLLRPKLEDVLSNSKDQNPPKSSD